MKICYRSCEISTSPATSENSIPLGSVELSYMEGQGQARAHRRFLLQIHQMDLLPQRHKLNFDLLTCQYSSGLMNYFISNMFYTSRINKEVVDNQWGVNLIHFQFAQVANDDESRSTCERPVNHLNLTYCHSKGKIVDNVTNTIAYNMSMVSDCCSESYSMNAPDLPPISFEGADAGQKAESFFNSLIDWITMLSTGSGTEFWMVKMQTTKNAQYFTSTPCHFE